MDQSTSNRPEDATDAAGSAFGRLDERGPGVGRSARRPRRRQRLLPATKAPTGRTNAAGHTAASGRAASSRFSSGRAAFGRAASSRFSPGRAAFGRAASSRFSPG
ncbi:hypothetical protein AB0M36_19340 [Actinoplanes sp. NPDC051346]|uniref:hypothetical protein n=1 Tax=Actinoplanes sp. NPDC051346 TaxID=3155048 RepID=UPI00342B8594